MTTNQRADDELADREVKGVYTSSIRIKKHAK